MGRHDAGDFRLTPEAVGSRAGLCGTCVHMKKIVSSKGSEFILCGLSETDERFRKYPPLPVTSCAGHVVSGEPSLRPTETSDRRR